MAKTDGELKTLTRPTAREQLKFLRRDIERQAGPGGGARTVKVLASRSFWGILEYRLERFFFLIFGEWYRFIRLPFIPVLNLIQAYSNIEIPYRAEIKGGLQIFHPSAGIVVSQFAVIGEDVTLYGGNIIGTRELHRGGVIRIGSHCIFGANSVVLGPLHIASGCRIGALACVIDDCDVEGATLVGVPAKIKQTAF